MIDFMAGMPRKIPHPKNTELLVNLEELLGLAPKKKPEPEKQEPEDQRPKRRPQSAWQSLGRRGREAMR